MAREVILACIVVGLVAFEVLTQRIDQRIETWARGDASPIEGERS